MFRTHFPGLAMKITIFNGSPADHGGDINAYLERLSGILRSPDGGGHLVRELKLRELNIKPCVGCFGCWLKTPGLCVHNDDSSIASDAAANSEFLIHASPLVMGFTSSLLRWAAEKTIVNLLPYFSVIKGEVRHKWRYRSKAPTIGVLVGREGDTSEDDLEIIRDIYQQIALEIQTRLRFVLDTGSHAQEVANAINGN